MHRLLPFISLFTVLATAPATTALSPLSIPLRQTALPGRHIPSLHRRSHKRSIPTQSLIDISDCYLADLEIGTPPQRVAILVDTGAWVTWVNPDCRRSVYQELCYQLPLYDLSIANSTRQPALDEIVQYGGGWGASLVGYEDVFTWGGETVVERQAFAVANRSVGVYMGVLGLGPDGGKGWDEGFSRYSPLTTMMEMGAIESRLFGLALGESVNWGEHTGSLVFGGVDRNKFTGSFFSTPIIPREEGVDSTGYWIQVDQIKHNAPDPTLGYTTNTTGWESRYFLDSGTTGVFIPRRIFDGLLADMNLTRGNSPDGFPSVNCTMREADASLEFVFGNGAIKVPYSALVHSGATGDTCFLALGSSGNATDDGDEWSVLGVGLLKAAYAVFDWDHREIHLAQWKNCTDTQDLVGIGTNDTVLSSITGGC